MYGVIRRVRKLWVLLLVAGIALIGAGTALIAVPLLSAAHRGTADQNALQAWNNGGSQALVGPVTGGARDAGKTTCGSSSPTDFALVRFDSPSQDHYAGVAGDGTWALLDSRSMVHYHGTPAPGQQGNVIIAFHREPDYEHIDQMVVGDKITIEDRACRTYVYQVTQRWDMPPSQVSQLTPTSGYDLTMITCDPWWQDYDRLVWRATLVSAPSSGTTVPGGAAPTAPPF